MAHLEDLLAVLGAVYSTRDREDGRRLPGTRRAIEQQVWQAVLLDELLDWVAARLGQLL